MGTRSSANDTSAFAALQDVGAALSAELDLNRLVHLIVRSATRLSGAAYGSFFERAVDAIGEEVWRLYALDGAPEEAFTRFGLPRSTALFKPTFRAESIVRSDDVASDPRYGSMGGMPAGHLPVRSYLAVPVVSRRGERLGALLFGHPEPSRFDDSVERLLVSFAGQAAVALDNAKLFREVRLNEDRFRAAVDAMQGVLWTNDAEGRMTGEQLGWAALTGQTYDQYQGYGWSTAIHPDDVPETIASWEAAVMARAPFVYEHRVRRADGRWGHFAVRAVPIIEEDGTVREWVGTHTDTTRQRDAEAALRSSNEELQRYTHMISHDLRAPLVNVMGFTAELREIGGELFNGSTQLRDEIKQEFDEALGYIGTSTERMDRLLSEILKLSREGRRRLLPVELNLDQLAARLIAGQQHQIETSGATVTIEPLPRLRADQAAVEQVLGNLIDNALKYRRREQPLQIAIAGAAIDGTVAISVRDNGRGIAASDHRRVFGLFRRSGPDVAPGEGVGLAYVEALVRAMGGTVSLESELGRGSTFTVSLPDHRGG